MMHEREKSDTAVVAAKPTNNAGASTAAAAEPVEPRAGTKRNAGEQSTHRTLGRARVTQALDRVRQAARQRKKERFTALLHHLSVDLFREAFLVLKRDAAPGVDDLTWRTYAADLERNLSDLHARVHRGAYRALPSRRTYIPKADGRHQRGWLPVRTAPQDARGTLHGCLQIEIGKICSKRLCCARPTGQGRPTPPPSRYHATKTHNKLVARVTHRVDPHPLTPDLPLHGAWAGGSVASDALDDDDLQLARAVLLAMRGGGLVLGQVVAGNRALETGELAYCANVSRSTASGHLSKLVAARLLTVIRNRRFSYYRIASPLVATTRRIFCQPCLDWSERRYHLKGLVGARILDRLLELGWLKCVSGSRALQLTSSGRAGLYEIFQIEINNEGVPTARLCDPRLTA